MIVCSSFLRAAIAFLFCSHVSPISQTPWREFNLACFTERARSPQESQGIDAPTSDPNLLRICPFILVLIYYFLFLFFFFFFLILDTPLFQIEAHPFQLLVSHVVLKEALVLWASGVGRVLPIYCQINGQKVFLINAVEWQGG